MPNTTDLLDKLGKILSEKLPALAADAIEAAIPSNATPLERAAIEIAVRLVRTGGEHGIAQGLEALAALIDPVKSSPSAAWVFRGMPDEAEALTSALQASEAAEQKRVAAWVVRMNDFFTALGTAVASSLLS